MTPAPPALVQLSHLTKQFAPLQWHWRVRRPVHSLSVVEALRDVTLTVSRGEILGLLGPNGAGKTTLLKILATLVLPTSGSACVGGYDVAQAPESVRRLVGWGAMEERSFYWRLTGRENLIFFAALHDLSARAAAARIAVLQAMLGLEALDRPVAGYSTGMRHRLALARVLLHAPQLLLLDEPTRSLDPVAAGELRRLLREELVQRQGCTVLVATHNLQEAITLCDRLAVLQGGCLVACDTPSALRQQAAAGGMAPLARLLDELAMAVAAP